MPKIPVPFATTQANRTHLNTKDGYVQNAYLEQGDKTYVVKRPGFYKVKASGITLSATDKVRGFIYCSAHSLYYACVGAKIYKIANDLSTYTDITPGTPPTNNGSPVYFTQTQEGSTTTVIMHQPGVTGQLFRIVASGTCTNITPTNWISTNTLGSAVTLDTTLYILSKNSALTTIQGSALSDPTTWAALNVINAYMYPDFGVTLAKFRNQLVCFKETSTEFFYDAANPTGSPLSRITEATIPLGCASALTVVYIDDSLVWMSKDQNGGLGFHMMGSNGVEKISTSYIDRTLSSIEGVVNTGVVQATYISFEGHKFYIVSIDGSTVGTEAIVGVAIVGKAIVGTTAGSFSRTFAYDLTTKQWAEWTSTNSSDNQTSFFGCFCISGSSISNAQTYSNALLLDKASGDIYELSPPAIGSVNPISYQDINPIQFKIVTNKLDGGNRNRKRMSLLEVTGDRDIQTNNLSVRYSDDDYNTWSNTRTVDLSSRAFLTNLGMFRSRAFEFTHTANRPLRLEAFECDVDGMDH